MEENSYFSFDGCLTPELYRRVNVAILRPVKTLSITLGVVLLLIGLITLFTDAFLGVLSLLVGLLLCFYQRIMLGITVRRFASTNSVSLNASYTVTFTDTAMVDQTAYSYAAYPYDKIDRVVDTAEIIIVFVGFNQFIALEKSRITAGDPAAFFTFLCTTHGVKYQKG